MCRDFRDADESTGRLRGETEVIYPESPRLPHGRGAASRRATRSEASLGSPHSTRSPRKEEATDNTKEVVPFDRPDAIAASWYQRRLQRNCRARRRARASIRVGSIGRAASRLPEADLGGTSSSVAEEGYRLGKVKKEVLRRGPSPRHRGDPAGGGAAVVARGEAQNPSVRFQRF